MTGDRRTGWTGRGRVVAVTGLTAVAAFATSTRTWFTVRLDDTELTRTTVAVAGQAAAPALTACALVALAAAAALAIARGPGRVLAAALVGLAGLGVAAAALAAVARPASAVEATLSARTGLVHAPARIAATAWPWVALAAGVALVAAALWAGLAQRGWTVTGRFDRGPARSGAGDVTGPDAADVWDALSEGRDPTRRPGPGGKMPE